MLFRSKERARASLPGIRVFVTARAIENDRDSARRATFVFFSGDKRGKKIDHFRAFLSELLRVAGLIETYSRRRNCTKEFPCSGTKSSRKLSAILFSIRTRRWFWKTTKVVLRREKRPLSLSFSLFPSLLKLLQDLIQKAQKCQLLVKLAHLR